MSNEVDYIKEVGEIKLLLQQNKEDLTQSIDEKFEKIERIIIDAISSEREHFNGKIVKINENISSFEDKTLYTQRIFIPMWIVDLFKKWIYIPLLLILVAIFGENSVFKDLLDNIIGNK